ncbi:proline-rich receptor-like protein kinase PERK12 [Iris pallida]|uniref:Proline-rich receptor-like protein kinase PERK12 n=1 Tax=Iris pallida TaxID=29817 RepID=A0AAX6HPP3_IRIPA|nr:proline-rich receptor-like protein kinase PERK12 [Iris pallida]
MELVIAWILQLFISVYFSGDCILEIYYCIFILFDRICLRLSLYFQTFDGYW